jgi:hypothetical protein
MKYLYKLSVCITMLLLMGIEWCLAHTAQSDVKILSSSNKGCTVVFEPSFIRIDTVTVGNQIYHRLDFDLAGFSGEAGDPLIPCRTLIVGVPQEGNVNVHLSGSEYEEIENIRLLPVPRLSEKKGLPVELYQEGAGYDISKMTPRNLFTVDPPSIWGEHRIVRIWIYPIQFNPKTNRIRQYGKMVFQITFGHSGQPIQNWMPKRNESIYQKALVNYFTAKEWRYPPKRKTRRIRKVSQTEKQYKIPISQEGIYKVTGSFLEGQGVDIDSIVPSTLKIYNNGGRQLPRSLSESRPDSLVENPILLYGMDDGQFNKSDYFLFYGKGVHDWEYDPDHMTYSHYFNVYTNQNIYWLVFGDGKEGIRISNANALSHQTAQQETNFLDRFFYEKDIDIHPGLKGGIRWYGRLFTNEMSSGTYVLPFNDGIADDTLRLKLQFRGATYSNTHYFSLSLDGQSIGQIAFTHQYEYAKTLLVSGMTLSGNKTLTLTYTGTGESPRVYLDWIEVEYQRQLKAAGGKIRVYSPVLSGLYDYHLTGFSSKPLVLDVTNSHAIIKIPVRSITEGWAFVESVGTEGSRTYAIAQSSGYLSPVIIEEDAISDLRNPPGDGADLIILTHEDFINQANAFKTYREDSLDVIVADIQNVYDEFSWGLYDPTAIRDFVKYAFDNWSIRPSYLLLFGDGDYDYRNILSSDDKNWIPPFEYDEDASEGATRASDDWYTYVAGDDTDMDLAVGRLPVRTESEAEIVVRKIIQYESEPEFGEWRNTVTLVGDDEIGEAKKEESQIHIDALESIGEKYLPGLYNLKKIYLTEYPRVPIVDRYLKPLAQKDVIDQINRGTLLIDYVGHGNEELWAHEWVFKRDRDLPNLENGCKLPLIYAATCAFGWFDNYKEQSFAEELIYAKNKGAIAVIAASRFCIGYQNETLNKQFIDVLFDESGATKRIGEALQLAKINNSTVENSEMYHLFGDPTMRLCAPKYNAVITEMDPDSIKALSVLSVKGQIKKDGNVWTNFYGKVAMRSFDSKKSIVYTTDGGKQIPYLLPGNALFRGEAKVENGAFRISFVVPKDISYGTQTGRFSFYFWDGDNDGGGFMDSIEVGGSSNIVDQVGPEIELVFSEDENFVSGGMVSEEPELIALIEDDSTGINIAGEIGHKIMMTLDQNQEDVTDYFQYNEGSYLAGKIIYPLAGITEGEHELLLKAWDNANNSGSSSIVFNVVPFDQFRIEDVLNYPNPLTTSTHFTFQLNHEADIDIKIFTVSGRLIRKLEAFGEHGFNMVYWDGRDEMGDALANGVYLYKVHAKTSIGGHHKNQSVIERLIIMR